MHIDDENAAELKKWIVKKLEFMYVDTGFEPWHNRFAVSKYARMYADCGTSSSSDADSDVREAHSYAMENAPLTFNRF